MVINGDITTGAIVAASLLSSRMIAPMATLCGVLARWQQVKAAKSSLDALMNLPVENSKDETRIHCPVLFGHYQFTDAMFRYYSDSLTVALRIKTLTIKPGERIAVLGRNGSGKSTLLQAMAGGMDLVGGELRLDNLSLPHIDVADVRRNVGLLTQNARLFHGTLRENLTMGAAHATDEAIFAALTVSGGADFIRRLPLGLDHPVMEGGVGLSGGQRQSLLLARMCAILISCCWMSQPLRSTIIPRRILLSGWAPAEWPHADRGDAPRGDSVAGGSHTGAERGAAGNGQPERERAAGTARQRSSGEDRHDEAIAGKTAAGDRRGSGFVRRSAR